MDLRTVMLLIAIGSFIFGLLLIVIKFKRSNPQDVPYWITSKILQAVGSLLLYYRTLTFDGVTLLANTILLLGCAYEAWVVGVITGRKMNRIIHLVTSTATVLVCSVTVLLVAPYRSGVFLLLQSCFYFLPAIFLIKKTDMTFSLRMILAVAYSITALVFLLGASLCFISPELAISLSSNVIYGVIPIISFVIFLTSGFILLMLAKERSDMQVLEIQKSLKKSEVRFQKIVEIAIEGILIFDDQYRITFANRNMASMLGYTVEEMVGRTYMSFFPESHLDVYMQQEILRRKGEPSVYESCLLTKDGVKRWFLISATSLINDNGEFEGSFGMFTDINERKEMELVLEESNRRLLKLSNQDCLTKIANRRCFDATLEHEYNRLKRTKSKLSIIMIDIDFFKEYNDYYGHVKGDECLSQIGEVLANCLNRSVDLAARYGGEEFACILPDIDINGAVHVAGRIQQGILNLKIEHCKSSISEYVTASFGVISVEYSPKISPSDVIAMADKLLYKAKVSGRNRIEYAEWKG